MTIAKRIFSPRFWKRAVAVHGFSGVVRAGFRSLRPSRRGSDEAKYLDLVGITDDPVEAIYLGREMGQTPVISFPLSRLRVESLGIRIDDLEANPFTGAVAEFLSGEHREYHGSILERFLDDWHPETIGEMLGLRDLRPDSRLAEELEAEMLPWSRPVSAEELAERRASAERSWAIKFGPPPEGGHGSTSYGPASEALGRYRFAKHTDVAASIAADSAGTDRSDPHWWEPARGGFIEAQLLFDGQGFAGIVREGKHRTAALAALGVDAVMVSLPATYPVVHRDQVESWPGVAGGVFEKEEALQVFDRFMEGSPPWSGVVLTSRLRTRSRVSPVVAEIAGHAGTGAPRLKSGATQEPTAT